MEEGSEKPREHDLLKIASLDGDALYGQSARIPHP